MVMKRVLLLSTVILLLAACAGSTVGYDRGSGDQTARATAVLPGGGARNSGADDLNVSVSLPDPPPVMPGMSTIDLEYAFEITNRSAAPVTIKRISIASAAGSYQLERWSRKYNKTIAAGAKDTLPFVARAVGVDSHLGSRAPMTVRAQIEFDNPDGKQETVVVRNVGSTVGIGVESDQ